MTDKKTLVLVDGSSYLYRAFHAMPDLRAVPNDPKPSHGCHPRHDQHDAGPSARGDGRLRRVRV